MTYRLLSQFLAPFLDGNCVAPHVVGMLLAVEAHVISARSVLFLLPRIGTAEVIGILGSPLLIGFLLLLAPTFGPTTRLLPSVEPRVRVIPMTTERTPPSREHTFLLQPTSSGETNLTSRQILRKVMWSDSGKDTRFSQIQRRIFTFLMSHHLSINVMRNIY